MGRGSKLRPALNAFEYASVCFNVTVDVSKDTVNSKLRAIMPGLLISPAPYIQDNVGERRLPIPQEVGLTRKGWCTRYHISLRKNKEAGMKEASNT